MQAIPETLVRRSRALRTIRLIRRQKLETGLAVINLWLTAWIPASTNAAHRTRLLRTTGGQILSATAETATLPDTDRPASRG